MRPLPCLALLTLTMTMTAACGGDPGGAPLPCGGRVTAVTERLGVHFPQGTPLDWESNPPATGPHYDNWAPWARGYDRPVPRGNYVHNLEHGGVVLLYRTAGGEVEAALRALGRGLSQDPLCAPPINARWLATPDPQLPAGVEVAAVAWGATYTAGCLDQPSLLDFVAQRYGRAPEATCADGVMAWQ